MNAKAARKAAELLVKARHEHRLVDELPDDCRPETIEEAYAIQDAMVPLEGAIAGWKIGAPGADAEPICAPLFARYVHTGPARLPATDFHLLGTEAEVAFTLAHDLPPEGAPYSREAVLSAVAGAHPAIEIADSRFTEGMSAHKMSQLADTNSNGTFIYGAAVEDWQGLDIPQLPVKLSIGGKVVAEHQGGNKAGDPVRLLVWAANHCAARGLMLKAGQVVTTGSYVGINPAQPGDTAVASFDGLDAATLEFTV